MKKVLIIVLVVGLYAFTSFWNLNATVVIQPDFPPVCNPGPCQYSPTGEAGFVKVCDANGQSCVVIRKMYLEFPGGV